MVVTDRFEEAFKFLAFLGAESSRQHILDIQASITNIEEVKIILVKHLMVWVVEYKELMSNFLRLGVISKRKRPGEDANSITLFPLLAFTQLFPPCPCQVLNYLLLLKQL